MCWSNEFNVRRKDINDLLYRCIRKLKDEWYNTSIWHKNRNAFEKKGYYNNVYYNYKFMFFFFNTALNITVYSHFFTSITINSV